MRVLLGTARRVLAVATTLYCVGLVVLALLWLAGIQGIWWLDLVNIFALCLFAPLFVIVPIAYLASARQLRSVIILASVSFVGLFGARLIPPVPQAADGARLRVATFNLHYVLEEAQLAATIAAIRAQHADVVALQELSIPAAGAIQRDLIGDYPYQALAPSESFTGMGLISRYALDLPRPAQQIPAQMALVHMAGTDVTLINVSLAAPEIKQRRLPVVRWVKWIRGYRITHRLRDIERVLQAIDQVHGPLVVAGDFNLSDREPDYAQFTARLQDAYRATSWGFGHTFPSSVHLGAVPISVPLIRIDYVWSGGGAVPAAARVACGDESDHCMVIADVQIAGPISQSQD